MSDKRIGFGRNALRSNLRDRNSMVLVDQVVLPHRGFFVPAFGVRRQLFPNDAAIEFHAKLTEYCERKPYRAYDLRQMGITVLDKSRLVGVFHRSDVQPDPAQMLQLAKNVREAIGLCVKSKPHLLAVPMGNVAVFGNRNNKICATLDGWRGFKGSYASKDSAGRVLANGQIVREINASVGEVVQFIDGGVNGEGDYVDISTRAIQRQSPHFTFAEKTRGQIGNSERADIDGQIGEFMPDELEFFDPVIHLGLLTPGCETTGYTNNMQDATEQTAGLFVRRPKFRDFGKDFFESCFGIAAA